MPAITYSNALFASYLFHCSLFPITMYGFRTKRIPVGSCRDMYFSWSPFTAVADMKSHD